jgi:hypothetical protein
LAVRFTRTSSQYWGRASGAVLNYNADYTFMAWVYLTTDVNGYYSLLGMYGSADSRSDVIQTASDGTTLNVYCGDADTGTSLDVNGSTLPIGQWIHIALSRERRSLSDSFVRAYLNGSQNIVGTHNITSRSAVARMYVGSWYGASDYANGRVAQIKAFQHVLTPDQIRAEMESAEPINRRTLFGWWPAWEPGAGVRNLDWSGNGYNWTETATPTDEGDPPFNFSINLIPVQWNTSTSDVTITVPIIAATAEAIAPAISTTSNVTIIVPIAAATAEAIAPAISTTSNATITVPIVAVTAEAIAPTVTTTSSVTINAPVATATAEAIAPAISAGANASISAPIAAATAEAIAPTIGTGVTVTVPAPAAATAQAIAPAIGTGQTVTVPAPAAATAQAIAPTITTTSSVTINAPIATATAEAIPPTVTSATQDHHVDVGNGYSDVTPRQIVRTSGNVLYVSGWKFDTYPHGGIGGGEYNSQTLRMYKAAQTGLPTSFTRLDSSNEPAGVVSWAMAIDRDDVIHVVWTTRDNWDGGQSYGWDGTDNYLKYCQFSTATDTWGTVENIETTMATIERGQGDELVAIAIDASGVPHVTYLKDDGTRRRVTYRNRSGGSWSAAATVDDQSFGASERCWHPGIVFDNAGRIVVTWMRGTNESSTTGRYFVRVYDGGWGTTHDVVGANVWTGIDTGTPIYVDAAGRYHTCYISTGKDAQYRFSDDLGATWTANHPSSGAFTADNPTPAPGPNGKVRIYCHGESSTNIVYFEGDGGSAAWAAAANYITDTGYDCSVNVRWSQYWNWRPSAHDVAYWKSDYPTNELYVGVDVLGSDAIIRAPVATATTEAIAPTVTTTSSVTIVAPIATATAQAIAPTVTTTSSVTINAPIAMATAEAIAPTVSVTSNVTIVAPVATATAETIAPEIGTGATVTVPAPAAATAQAIAPTVTTTSNVTISVPVATATAEAIAPTLGTGVTVTVPAPVTATAQAIAPTVTTTSSVTINAPIAMATAEAIAPTVSVTSNVTIVAPVATATTEAIAPAVSVMGNITISAPAAEATAQAIAPAIGVGVTVTVPVAAATAEAIAPVVTATTGVTISVPVATATVEAIAPVISATRSVTINAVIATATAEAIAPAISAGSNVTVIAIVATATAEAIAPAISAGTDIVISAIAATATAEAIAPSVSVVRNVTVLAIVAAARAEAIAPAVSVGMAPSDVLAIAVTIDRAREFEMTIDRARYFDLEF